MQNASNLARNLDVAIHVTRRAVDEDVHAGYYLALAELPDVQLVHADDAVDVEHARFDRLERHCRRNTLQEDEAG